MYSLWGQNRISGVPTPSYVLSGQLAPTLVELDAFAKFEVRVRQIRTHLPGLCQPGMVRENPFAVYVAVHKRFLNARHGERLPVRGKSGPTARSRDGRSRHDYRTSRCDRASLFGDFDLHLLDHDLLNGYLFHDLLLHHLLNFHLFDYFLLNRYLFHDLLDHNLLYGHLLNHLNYPRCSRFFRSPTSEGERHGSHSCHDNHHPIGELLTPHNAGLLSSQGRPRHLNSEPSMSVQPSIYPVNRSIH